ncbi:MAG: DnaJ domain-containing protein [Nitrospirae bacterium]|nr:DnaJ domain-containing protein [Nitrospirota bacterium]MBF0540735.1 DnaJ domain-containing protein [Nitrospirota bacterium]
MPFTIIDNVIVALILWQMIRKVRTPKKRFKQKKTNQSSYEKSDTTLSNSMDITEAYKILGANQQDSLEEIRKTYIEKVSKNHPDKVTHLSEELQTMASEITQKLNQAFEIIKRQKLS